MSLRHAFGRAPSAAGKVLLGFARCFARLRAVRDLPDRELPRCYNDNNAFFERNGKIQGAVQEPGDPRLYGGTRHTVEQPQRDGLPRADHPF